LPYAKTSERAERRALREKMRALGLSHQQIAFEFGRRYSMRPRTAWRHAHGWSLKQAAERIIAYAVQAGLDPHGNTVAMTGPHLCEMEAWPGYGTKPTGRRPTPYLLSLLSAVYACAIADLLDLADYEHIRPADLLVLDKTAPAGGRVEPSAPARPDREEQVGALAAGSESDDVRRSEFLMVTGAALAGVLAPPLVHEWPGMRDPGPPEPTDLMLAQIRAQIEGFRWLDRKQGSYGLLAHTTRHARSLVGLWRLTDEANPLRRDLAAVAADACHLVAYQAFDQGERALAAEWYRCAAGLADRGSAKDLYVFAVCGVAYMHARSDDGELALSVLHQLASLGLSAAASCYVAVYEAHAHASMRQQPSALRALDRAVEYGTRASGEAPSPWLGIPDSAFAERQRAMILAGFGAPEALSLLERLGRHTPGIFQRYRVTLLTDRAMAHARLGDTDEAADLLATALHRNESIRSAEKRAQILAVRQVLNPHVSARSVRALDEILITGKRTAHRPGISQ
jgi:hypothetical protein